MTITWDNQVGSQRPGGVAAEALHGAIKLLRMT
jgi:hypothetical protein